MSIEEHIENVDWTRVREKSRGLANARRELQAIVTSFIPFVLLLQLNVVGQLEQYEALWDISPIPTVNLLMRIVPFVMLACFLYSGYSYFKWSRYDVMRK